MVFLGTAPDRIVLTAKFNALSGSGVGNWEILTTLAFVTIIVPPIVFFLAATLFRARAACRLGERKLRQCNRL